MSKNVSYYCDKCKRPIEEVHELRVTHHTPMSLDNCFYLCRLCYEKFLYFLANQNYKEDA